MSDRSFLEAVEAFRTIALGLVVFWALVGMVVYFLIN